MNPPPPPPPKFVADTRIWLICDIICFMCNNTEIQIWNYFQNAANRVSEMTNGHFLQEHVVFITVVYFKLQRIKIYKTIILFIVLYGYETCLSTYGENIDWECLRTKCWGEYLDIEQRK
jgi:hypothetical protein